MKVAISGASGLIGSALSEHLRTAGHDVLALTRAVGKASPNSLHWDPARADLDAAALEGIDAFVNLSGENLGERWSAQKKQAFRDSRMQSTSLIASTLTRLRKQPSVFVSASAIGYYGSTRGSELLDETSAPGTDFLAGLCKEWESATRPAADAGIRVVNSRFGIVLSPDGGVLEKLIPIFNLGAGGKVGSGDQWVSWIARTDIVSAIAFVIQRADLSGPVNLTAPNPVTNETLAKSLGHVLHRPAVAPVPAAMVKLMLGREMADETALASQRVLPRKLQAAGFQWAFPDVEAALRHELKAA